MKMFSIKEHGGIETLQSLNVQGPRVMTSNDVYLKQTHVGVNFVDVAMRSGSFPIRLESVKDGVIGCEAIGTIAKVGSAVKGLTVSQRVLYCLGTLGGYVDARTIDQSFLIAVPDDISDLDALCCGRRGLMAHSLLFSVFKVYKESRILVHSVAGGVGHLLASWASSMGVTVIGTIGSNSKRGVAESLGCDLVVDRDNIYWADEVMDFTNGLGVHAVYDGIGAPVFQDSLRCLSGMGIYISYGEVGGKIIDLDASMFANKSLFFTKPILEHYKPNKVELLVAMESIFEALRSGKLRPIVSEYSWNELPHVQYDLEAGNTVGSLVVRT